MNELNAHGPLADRGRDALALPQRTSPTANYTGDRGFQVKGWACQGPAIRGATVFFRIGAAKNQRRANRAPCARKPFHRVPATLQPLCVGDGARHQEHVSDVVHSVAIRGGRHVTRSSRPFPSRAVISVVDMQSNVRCLFKYGESVTRHGRRQSPARTMRCTLRPLADRYDGRLPPNCHRLQQ